jgi:Ca2+-binding EF-hand superfamily protein
MKTFGYNLSDNFLQLLIKKYDKKGNGKAQKKKKKKKNALEGLLQLFASKDTPSSPLC